MEQFERRPDAVKAYETPRVTEIGAVPDLTLGASGTGFDWGQHGMVPGDDYIPNPNKRG